MEIGKIGGFRRAECWCNVMMATVWTRMKKRIWRSFLLLGCIVFLGVGTIPLPAIAQSIPATPETADFVAGPNFLTVAAVNVENLDARDPSDRFADFGRLIVENLAAPDIIALSEVQDNDGPANTDVTAAVETYRLLSEAIAAAGGPLYAAIDVPPVDDMDGGQPGGNIRVGFLFNPTRVTLATGTPGGPLTAVQVTDEPALTVNPGRIDPTNPAFVRSRKPLAAEFEFGGNSVFVVSNHFASKRGGAASDRQRLRQAQAVHLFAEEVLDEDFDANVIVAGDLNDFADSPPLRALAGDVLQNLLDLVPKSDRFTFEFRGNLQVLDHILVSQNLLFDADARFDIVHANVGQPDPASDHDPVLAGFTLPPVTEVDLEPLPDPEPVAETAIFPDLNGEELAERLAQEYAVRERLSYGRARDYMYGQIDNENGIVSGVYTGFEVAIAPNIGTARRESFRKGINAEHSWPQSQGTRSTPARADLHHLFPTRIRVNSTRGNKPFAEIPDLDTDDWFFQDLELTFPPDADSIDAYSEADRDAFEPREAFKGDIARAQFYVYTIYRDRVNGDFFAGQRETLCQWHEQDPADAAERERSAQIRSVQGNDNPFVLDPTLSRLYCE